MIKKFKDLPTNYKSALVIFIALVLWIASGIFKSDSNIATVETTEAEKIISVRATDVVAEDKIYYLTIILNIILSLKLQKTLYGVDIF